MPELTEKQRQFSYRRAQEAIDTARASGAQELDLGANRVIGDVRFGALTQLPPEIASLTELQTLKLNATQVSNLTPIANLANLRCLELDQTRITDLSPLAALTGLVSLSLRHTRIRHLAPIAALTRIQTLELSDTEINDLSFLAELMNLQNLSFSGTDVGDLRPLIKLTKLGSAGYPGLSFDYTTATHSDRDLEELSKIEGSSERAEKTLAYLATLPPWPEPLPWLKDRPADQVPRQPFEAEVPTPPAPMTAPLQVAEVDGTLRPSMPGDGLHDNVRLLAHQAWAALRNYLIDLAPLKPLLDNQMPTLARALDRFDSALGTEFAALNVIALGIHGNRILRLTDAASDSLSEANAAEITEFAAAVALFLGRFPDWREYRDVDAPTVPGARQMAEELPMIDSIVGDLFDRDAIDASIPLQLRDLEGTVREAPEDRLATRGLLASFGNVLAALAEKVMAAVARKTRDTVLDVLAETKKLAVKATAGSLLAAALDIFANKAAMLKHLATSFSDWFAWLGPILRFLGL